MDNTKNALAELAKRLDTRKSKDFIVRIDAHDVSLARRIIEELAKRNIGLIPTDCYGCGVLKTLANCRVIAEEGETE